MIALPADRKTLAKRIASATLLALSLPLAWLGIGCSGSGSSSSSTSSTSTTSVYPAAYKAAFANFAGTTTATVSYPSSCTLTLTTTGVPTYHNDYYLVPVATATSSVTTVAYSAASNSAMYLLPYTPADIKSSTITVNICPTKASSTTVTNPGVIGYTLQGEAIYNAYEGNGAATPAMSDNATYSFTTAGGVKETAYFIDQCNSHPTPPSASYTWHHHGVPTCLIATLDGTSGPSHLLGFALDGFPIYGGRDINGAVISTSQLDACNGITSVTPEFATATYHYVLPLNTTNGYSSMNCYSGSTSNVTIGQMKKLACNMTKMANFDASAGPRQAIEQKKLEQQQRQQPMQRQASTPKTSAKLETPDPMERMRMNGGGM
jgi:hypothetical protein